MESARTTFRRADGLDPNPKLRLREQFREVMRFKHFPLRTAAAYWQWVKQFLVFHRGEIRALTEQCPPVGGGSTDFVRRPFSDSVCRHL